MRSPALLLASTLLIACTSDATRTDSNPAQEAAPQSGTPAAQAPVPAAGQPTNETPAAEASTLDPIAALDAHVAAFSAKPEHSDPKVRVRHLLVSFAGTGTSATRTKQAAHELTAELWARIQAGEDFAGLVREHSDDSPEGVYTMVQSGPTGPKEFQRNGMVAAFGDTGWRLQEGEFGVAAFDSRKSPYGWHIVQRIAL